MFGKIIGTGSFIPERVVTNVDLEQYVDTNDEWIRERTGIARRHVMEQETTKDMAVLAAKRAIEMAAIAPEEIDMVIVSTLSSDIALPSTACYVQAELGAENAVCFDLNAACTGFILAYNTVQTYIAAGLCKTALIIGAEGLSKLVDWSDRGTCILFADGAGAAIVQADEDAVFDTVMHADGGQGDALTMKTGFAERVRGIDVEPGTGVDEANQNILNEKDTYIGMDGQAVFRFAVKQVPACILELMEKRNISEKDIDLFLLHQANERIVKSIIKRVKTDDNKVPMNVQEYGNTSSASVPILLDEMVRQDRLKKGDRVIMAGFGAGLTWCASYLEF